MLQCFCLLLCAVHVVYFVRVYTVGLCPFVFDVCMDVAKKKLAVWGPPVSVIFCLLIEFNGQKEAYYARRFVQGKMEVFH